MFDEKKYQELTSECPNLAESVFWSWFLMPYIENARIFVYKDKWWFWNFVILLPQELKYQQSSQYDFYIKILSKGWMSWEEHFSCKKKLTFYVTLSQTHHVISKYALKFIACMLRLIQHFCTNSIFYTWVINKRNLIDTNYNSHEYKQEWIHFAWLYFYDFSNYFILKPSNGIVL